MVVVGERDEPSQPTALRNVDSLPWRSDVANDITAVDSEKPVLPKKGKSVIRSDQDFVFNTKREPFVGAREYFKDSSTFHEYVNTEKLAEHRQVFDVRRRNDSLDSTEEGYSLRVPNKFQGDYEYMSSPDSFSTSSSNRSSNTSSLAQGSSSPDSASLSSFSDRFVFGRGEGSKRCSQASTASQESHSSRHSWGKTSEYIDQSDGCASSSNTYENTPYHETYLGKSKKMSLNAAEEEAPPLPQRLIPRSSSNPPQVELIMPYKVVDLEELQRSLDDMDTYSAPDDSDSDDINIYNECLDSPAKEESNTVVIKTVQQSKPILPPKRRSLSSTLLNPVSNGEVATLREKPIPVPRQSVVFNKDTSVNKQQSESDDENNSLNRLSFISGYLSRQKSLPVGRVVHSGRQSTSPQRIYRPQRSAPPPPPLHNDKSPSSRPVSEMLPRSQPWHQSSPTELKRSNTVSMVQISTSNAPETHAVNRNSVQISSISSSTTATSNPSPYQTGQIKEETGKSGSSKAGVFLSKSKALKKAFTKAVKKQPKKDLVIGPPTDFASLYQPQATVERNERERKTVSFFDCEEPEDKVPSTEVGTENGDKEELYHNFPLSHADDSPEKLVTPKKPPRRFTSPNLLCHDGYLQPSTSRKTKNQEDEIDQKKLPELGPLPITPASSPEKEELPVTVAPSDEDNQTSTSEVPSNPGPAAKPKVPRRPDSLKPKIQKKRAQNTPLKQPDPEEQNLDTTKPMKDSANLTRKQDNTTLAGVPRRSRSCEVFDVDDTRDADLTNMHVTVLSDILLRWRNMLRRPKISLSGACWEDFEIVEGGSWPKVSEDHGSVLQPVQLKKSSQNLDLKNYESQFIAKIKSQNQSPNCSKSCYDQDYSVCSIVEPHENVARVLAYFRGDIGSQVSGFSASSFHTTISITDQVPVMTCDEFVTKSMDSHNSDPYSYERVVCLLILQCFLGLHHLHQAGFTHGNLILSNLYLIKHENDLQLFLGNLGKSQPLPKERRGTETRKAANLEGVTSPSGVRNDLSAVSEVIAAMLHSSRSGDENGNHVKCRTSPLFAFLDKVSSKLRDGTATLRQAIGFLQGLLWGPFKIDHCDILSEGRVASWLNRQRGEFIAKLAMDEALSRTVPNQNRTRFSMEDFLLCDYLNSAHSKHLLRTGKYWFYAT